MQRPPAHLSRIPHAADQVVIEFGDYEGQELQSEVVHELQVGPPPRRFHKPTAIIRSVELFPFRCLLGPSGSPFCVGFAPACVRHSRKMESAKPRSPFLNGERRWCGRADLAVQIGGRPYSVIQLILRTRVRLDGVNHRPPAFEQSRVTALALTADSDEGCLLGGGDGCRGALAAQCRRNLGQISCIDGPPTVLATLGGDATVQGGVVAVAIAHRLACKPRYLRRQ